MVWLNNSKILTKILLLVGLLCVFIGGISYNGWYGIGLLHDDILSVESAAHEVDLGNGLLQATISIESIVNEVTADPGAENFKLGHSVVSEMRDEFTHNIPILKETGDKDQVARLEDIEKALQVTIPAAEAFLKTAESIDISTQRDYLTESMNNVEPHIDALIDATQAYVDESLANAKEVAVQSEKSYKSVRLHLIALMAAALLFGIAGAIFLGVYVIAKPLARSVSALRSLIEGHLDIEIDGSDRHDEVGDVARAALTFKDVLIKNRDMAEAEKAEQLHKEERQRKVQELIDNFDSTATQTVSTVASASTQLSQTAEEMSKVASDTNQQSTEVASASEQASHNVQSVASAAEEMAATVQEISKQISVSNNIVSDAMQKAERADNSSRELVEMSRSVGDIATLIEDIAGQINLLALNATIESARSGEAGKGFAVVANEVKNLATQTAKATEQIRTQLEAVQSTASSVAGSLGEVRESIVRVSESSAAIAAAVEEQSAATHEIVSNMSTATHGVEQINGSIFAIKDGTNSTTEATRQVLDAARMLSQQAEKMDREVKTFLHDILAA